MSRKLIAALVVAGLLSSCGGGKQPETPAQVQEPEPLPVTRLGGCMGARALMASYGEPLVIADAADFDGTNDYMSRGALTGIADSKQGIFSAWLRIDGGGSTFRILLDGYGAINYFSVQLTAGNAIQLIGFSSAPTQILTLASTSSYLAGATWLHVLASWDTSLNTGKLYINDILEGTDFPANTAIAHSSSTSWYVGRYGSPAYLTNGCLAEVYFAPGQYLDFSVVSNRRKFISATGKPVHLGATGSLPTGTAPIVYLHLDNGEAVANFATNRGTGGNFTITGSLDTATTSPSD